MAELGWPIYAPAILTRTSTARSHTYKPTGHVVVVPMRKVPLVEGVTAAVVQRNNHVDQVKRVVLCFETPSTLETKLFEA